MNQQTWDAAAGTIQGGQKMNEWIYTSDKLPAPGVTVLLAVISGAWDTTPKVKVGHRWVSGFFVDGDENKRAENEVVAWMPLPELPTPPNWRVKHDE